MKKLIIIMILALSVFPFSSEMFEFTGMEIDTLWVKNGATIDTALVVNGNLTVSGTITGDVTGDISTDQIQTGTAASYWDDVTTGDNVWQMYVEDTLATSYTDGISITMKTGAGDGSGALRAYQGAVTAESGASLGEIYCDSKYIVLEDGSDIATNAYNIWYLDVEETDQADVGNGYKSPGVFIYETSGVNPSCTWTTPGFTAALAGVVKDDANTKPGATVLAFAEGDATGTTIPSAFKAVSVRSTVGGGFAYGLDLYDEAGYGNNVITADIRLESGSTIANPTAGKTVVSDTLQASYFSGSVLESFTSLLDSLTTSAGDSIIIGWVKAKPETLVDVR